MNLNLKDIFKDTIENLKINKNQVIINGKVIKDFTESSDKIINIFIEGNTGNIESTNGNINITGNVEKNVKTTNGNVLIENNVTGDIDTINGDVTVHNSVQGSIETVNGNIRVKK